MGLIANVYRSGRLLGDVNGPPRHMRFDDCTINGWSVNFDRVCEVNAEGGGTRAQETDPACRLILHQLAYLLGMSGGYDLTEYRKYTEACEAAVAEIEKDSK